MPWKKDGKKQEVMKRQHCRQARDNGTHRLNTDTQNPLECIGLLKVSVQQPLPYIFTDLLHAHMHIH